MAWNKEQVVELIDLVREKPSLWDIRDPLYKLCNVRLRHLEEVTDKLQIIRPGTTSKEVKLKWTYLRGNYIVEKNEMGNSFKSGSGRDMVYQPQIYYFANMGFLNDTTDVREHISTFNINLNPAEPFVETVEFENESSPETLECIDVSPQLIETPKILRPLKRKRKISSDKDSAELLIEKATMLLDLLFSQKPAVSLPDGEEEIMGKYVTIRLKQLKKKGLKQDLIFKIQSLLHTHFCENSSDYNSN